MENGDGNDDWGSWRKLVIFELNRHNNILEKLVEENINVKTNLTKLNIYAMIAGAVGGIFITIMLNFIIG